MNLNDKLSEVLIDRGVLESYLLSLSYKVTNPELTSQYKLVNDPDSNRVNDLLINETKPIIVFDNLLKLRDTDKKLQLEGKLSKMIFNKNYKVDFAHLLDQNWCLNLQGNWTLMKNL